MRDWQAGFKMARDVQGDFILNLLSGISCERILHTPVQQHLNFFSAQESRGLAQALIDAETKPDRIASVIEGEGRLAMREFQRLMPEDPAEARRRWLTQNAEQLQRAEETEIVEQIEELRQARRVLERGFEELIRKPTAYVQLRAEVEAHLRRHIQEASEAFALKGGRFHSSAPSPHAPSGDALRNYLLQYFEPLSLVGNVARQYWEMRTRRRLLALHLLLRAYYLRERRYPDNLRQLPIGAWATDPFSGELPVYQREGDRYRLYSVGVADTPAQR